MAENSGVKQVQNFNSNPIESAGYFEVPGAHLYTVLHSVADPIARVLLIGPFASERHYSYIPWVRWARYLASRGVECLRYDYRGVGESTGVFEEMSFENWSEDVELLAGWLNRRTPEAPFLLQGLQLGAVLASNAFEKNIGDGLLLWAPTEDANQALRTLLLRQVATANMFKYGRERKPISQYIHQLETGVSVEVEGYQWSSKQWLDSLKFAPPKHIEGDSFIGGKPVRVVKLEKGAAPLVKGSSVEYEGIGKDFSWLYAENYEWIRSHYGRCDGQAIVRNKLRLR